MPQEISDVLIVGAGPVGLTLALALARHGVRPRIIDKASEPSPYCRAIGVTPRTLELFEDLGPARALIDAGLWLEGTRVAIAGQPERERRHDFTDLPYAQLGVPQDATEAVLAAALWRAGIVVERGCTLAGLDQSGNGMTAALETSTGREEARFRYVVGCDGAHSAVRHALGIPFEGDAFPMEFMLGDVKIDWDLPRGLAMQAMKLVEDGPPDVFVAIPLPGRGRYRVSMLAPERLSRGVPPNGSDHGIQASRPGPTLADLQEVADRLLPGRALLSDMRWSSIFRISMRLAARYREGNAFIAGDACHIHPPTGGQGMNTGIQDAYNLAWKLALVLGGRAAPKLLDSYEAERRPVAAEVVARTTEQSINFGRDKTPPHRLQDTQLLVAYPDSPLSAGTGGGKVAAGDRIPDVQGLRRRGLGFPLRLFDLLRGPRFVLLVTLGQDGDSQSIEACAARLERRWPGLVRVVAVALGELPAEDPPGVELVQDTAGQFADAFGAGQGAALLVRPDNYAGLVLAAWSEAEVESYLSGRIGLG